MINSYLINGNCLQCGDPAFLLDTSIECSNNECKHFDYRVAAALLKEPEFDLSKMTLTVDSKDADWYWFRNADMANLPFFNHACKIGKPHGTDMYKKEELAKHGMTGLYAKKGSNVKKTGYISSFGKASNGKCPILNKIREGKNS